MPGPPAGLRTCPAVGAPAGFSSPFSHPGRQPGQSEERVLNYVKGFKSGGGREAEGGRAAAEALIKSGAAGRQGSHSEG